MKYLLTLKWMFNTCLSIISIILLATLHQVDIFFTLQLEHGKQKITMYISFQRWNRLSRLQRTIVYALSILTATVLVMFYVSKVASKLDKLNHSDLAQVSYSYILFYLIYHKNNIKM